MNIDLNLKKNPPKTLPIISTDAGCNVEKSCTPYSIGTRVYVFKTVYGWIIRQRTLSFPALVND